MRAILIALCLYLIIGTPIMAQEQHYHLTLDDPLQGVTFSEMNNFYGGSLTNDIFTYQKIKSIDNGYVAFWFNNLKATDNIQIKLEEIGGSRFYSMQFYSDQIWLNDSESGVELVDTRDANDHLFRIEKCEGFLIYHVFGYAYKFYDLGSNTAEFQIVVKVTSADQTVLDLDINSTPDKLCCPLEPDDDLGLNWITTTTYDGSSDSEAWINIIGESRVYADELGRTIQSQTKDYRTNKIWATTTLFDQKGRPAITTLPAPTDRPNIKFKNNFVTNANGTAYGISDFDQAISSNNLPGEINNPKPVGTQAGTLGAWYSDQNTEEPYQAITDFPYSRTEYSELTGAARRSAAPGDAYRMGEGHESAVYSMPAGTELEPLFGTGNRHPMCLLMGTSYEDARISNRCTGGYTGLRQYFKSISVDADGRQAIIFTDINGREVARSLSGKVDNINVKVQLTTIKVAEDAYHDIHVTDAGGSLTTLTLSSSAGTPKYSVYDLTTDDLLHDNIQSTSLQLEPGFYRIVNHRGDGISLTVSYDLNYHNFSLNIHDDAGQLIATVAPNDIDYDHPANPQHLAFSFYKYNSLGQLVWEETPDAGHTDYYYRKDGLLRFSQNAQQVTENKFSYTKYDRAGRSIEVGECNIMPSNLADNVDQSDYPNSGLSQQTYYQYDAPDLSLTRSQQFLMGRLSKSWTSANLTQWYSYDIQGRITWMAQKIDNDTGTKFVDYTYDLQSNITEVAYQKGQADAFIHHYTYLPTGELTKVTTSKDGSPRERQAEYEYYTDGSIKKVNIADGLQEMHYIYTLQGQLKAINPEDIQTSDMSVSDKVFSLALDYYEDDYIPANASNISNYSNLFTNSEQSFTGSIAVQRWKSRAPIAGTNLSGAYNYQYNHRNELKEARFSQLGAGAGTYNGALLSSNDFKMNAAYDLNGNILFLNRWSCSGCLGSFQFDDLAYQYDTSNGKNRLLSISDNNDNITPYGDLTHQSPNNYDYNNIGQLTDDESDNISIVYDVYGKVVKVLEKSSGQLKIEYIYDANGQRAKKIVHDAVTTTTWYFRDASGAIRSLYERNGSTNPVDQSELPVYAANRIGVGYLSGSTVSFKYESTDHLGNVRATFGRNASGDLEVFSYADYFPFGWKIPTRQANPNDYRFGYQGEFAEQEEETGWNAFELRMYDARVGRWMARDPYDEFWSPYLAFSNDPINFVDPDGGRVEDIIFVNGNGVETGRIPLPGEDIIVHSLATVELVDAPLFDNNIQEPEPDRLGLIREPTREDWRYSPFRAAIGQGTYIGLSLIGLNAIDDFTAALVNPDYTTGQRINLATGLFGAGKGKGPKINKPYKRPSYSVTRAQRKSVQSKPCVDCGKVDKVMRADHKKPLVEEYYETGTIDKKNMRSLDAVQPQCANCSNKQGGKLSKFSKDKKKELGF